MFFKLLVYFTHTGKESWIQLIAPDHNYCPDNGEIFCQIVRILLDKAAVRRKLVRLLGHSCLDAFRLMVIRGDEFFVKVIYITIQMFCRYLAIKIIFQVLVSVASHYFLLKFFPFE